MKWPFVRKQRWMEMEELLDKVNTRTRKMNAYRRLLDELILPKDIKAKLEDIDTWPEKENLVACVTDSSLGVLQRMRNLARLLRRIPPGEIRTRNVISRQTEKGAFIVEYKRHSAGNRLFEQGKSKSCKYILYYSLN